MNVFFVKGVCATNPKGSKTKGIKITILDYKYTWAVLNNHGIYPSQVSDSTSLYYVINTLGIRWFNNFTSIFTI
jgi:hypothetical protein